MARSVVILLPGGIKVGDEWHQEVELAPITGFEEDIMADSTLADDGSGRPAVSGSARMTKVLSACCVRIGKLTRPEGATRSTNPNFFETLWQNAFMLDRSYAILQLRALTLGKSFKFSATCPNCGKTHDVSVDLLSFGQDWIQPKHPDILTIEHQFTTPEGGNLVCWRSLTGSDEEKVRAIKDQRKSDQLTSILMLRTTRIDGSSEKMDKYTALRSMSSGDRVALRKQFELVEGVQPMLVPLKCSNIDCRKEFRSQVDTGDRSFFFPSEI